MIDSSAHGKQVVVRLARRLITGRQLAAFARGMTLAEANERFPNGASWWAMAAAQAEERGWLRSPGASPTWFLTLRGMAHAEFPKRAA